MNKQVLYKDNEAKKYYLSPYTDINIISEYKVVLERRDTRRKIILEVSSEKALKVILQALQDGAENEQIIAILGNMELFDMLLQSGVIE